MVAQTTLDALTFLGFLLTELVLIYAAVSFGVVLLQGWLGDRRLRRVLGDRAGPWRLLLAAGLGIVTPFCSCSTVPVVAGMSRAGVAWPLTATFLVVSPLVNPALFALMWALVSPTYAALYVAASLAIALLVGAVIALAGWSPAPGPASVDGCGDDSSHASERGPGARRAAREALAETWRLSPLFLLAAVVGTVLKYWVGTAWITGLLEATSWWGVPMAAVLGLPVYASTAVLLPLGALLLQQGLNLGVVTAFLMGATGFSVPEGLMLKEIIGTRRLAVLGAAFVPAVIVIGYGFQWLT